MTKQINKADKLKELTDEIIDIYKAKNKDYGDSFSDSFKEFGITSAVVRMNDKMNRIKSLAKSDDRQVKDESLRDTLVDLANYALMTVLELEISPDDNAFPFRKTLDPEEVIEVNGIFVKRKNTIGFKQWNSIQIAKSLEDGKLYYLKFSLSGIDDEDNYLNFDKRENKCSLNNNWNSKDYETQFTKKDILKLIVDCNIDLAEFEIVEVKDESKN